MKDDIIRYENSSDLEMNKRQDAISAHDTLELARCRLNAKDPGSDSYRDESRTMVDELDSDPAKPPVCENRSSLQ
jgi:hypothetical protein